MKVKRSETVLLHLTPEEKRAVAKYARNRKASLGAALRQALVNGDKVLPREGA